MSPLAELASFRSNYHSCRLEGSQSTATALLCDAFSAAGRILRDCNFTSEMKCDGRARSREVMQCANFDDHWREFEFRVLGEMAIIGCGK